MQGDLDSDHAGVQKVKYTTNVRVNEFFKARSKKES